MLIRSERLLKAAEIIGAMTFEIQFGDITNFTPEFAHIIHT